MDAYIEELKGALNQVRITTKSKKNISYADGVNELVKALKSCKGSRKGIYLCGNGGSAGIAQHMAADFLKNGGLSAYSLYGQATLTCLSNDLAYKYVFSKQLELMAREGDFLVAVSSSGESENIVEAIKTIRKFHGTAITLTGFKESNPIRNMGDWNIYVPKEHYGMVESIHNIILQELVDKIVDMDGVALRRE